MGDEMDYTISSKNIKNKKFRVIVTGIILTLLSSLFLIYGLYNSHNSKILKLEISDRVTNVLFPDDFKSVRKVSDTGILKTSYFCSKNEQNYLVITTEYNGIQNITNQQHMEQLMEYYSETKKWEIIDKDVMNDTPEFTAFMPDSSTYILVKAILIDPVGIMFGVQAKSREELSSKRVEKFMDYIDFE